MFSPLREHAGCVCPYLHKVADDGVAAQVIAVLDAMPSSNLKPDTDDQQLEASKVYRTTYMFSATMPAAVERLARKYLRRPVVVNIGSAGRATDNVTQVRTCCGVEPCVVLGGVSA